MQKITYYDVGDCYDVEGRGPWGSIGKFSTETAAKSYAKGAGNYGRDADVKEVKLIICDDDLELKEIDRLKKIEKALDKLSANEKYLLVQAGILNDD